MADYGFRARNGSNEIQIDSTYKNFALRDKGVITASEGWFHVNFRQANAYTARNTGVVAFRSMAPPHSTVCRLAAVACR